MYLNQLVNPQIYHKPLSEIKTEKRCIINTINPHSYCESKKDNLFEKALLESDVLLPDGSGIVLATKILTGKKINFGNYSCIPKKFLNEIVKISYLKLSL